MRVTSDSRMICTSPLLGRVVSLIHGAVLVVPTYRHTSCQHQPLSPRRTISSAQSRLLTRVPLTAHSDARTKPPGAACGATAVDGKADEAGATGGVAPDGESDRPVGDGVGLAATASGVGAASGVTIRRRCGSTTWLPTA